MTIARTSGGSLDAQPIAETSPESRSLLSRVTDGPVTSLLRSPLSAALIFLATVIPVCSDPLLAVLSGSGQWGHIWPPLVVISLVSLGCLLQAVAASQLASHPALSVVGTSACYLIVAIGLNVPTWVAPMHLVIGISMFALGSYGPAGRAALTVSVVLVAAVAVLAFWAQEAGLPPSAVLSFVLTEGGGLVSVSVAAVGLGLLWSAHERRTQAARKRAQDAERERERAVEESRNAERGRIAQELHDVAGQHLAGLVSLCDASLELAPARPAQALELIEEVRAEGRYAAASLYGALGDLRAVDTATQSPTPDLRRIDALIDFWSERGMKVSLRAQGELGLLPVVVSTTAYRAVKEGLSNAAKHAPGAPVDVTVRVTSSRLDATVVNGPANWRRAAEEELGLGWGLDSLRDKLALVDGKLHSSAEGAGGWRFTVQIPFPRQGEAIDDHA